MSFGKSTGYQQRPTNHSFADLRQTDITKHIWLTPADLSTTLLPFNPVTNRDAIWKILLGTLIQCWNLTNVEQSCSVCMIPVFTQLQE